MTPKCRICGVEIVRGEGEKITNYRVAKTCKKPQCVAELRSRRGKENAKKSPGNFKPLPVPEPLPRAPDMLITRVETPLSVDALLRYRMPQALWLFN